MRHTPGRTPADFCSGRTSDDYARHLVRHGREPDPECCFCADSGAREHALALAEAARTRRERARDRDLGLAA